MLIIIIARSKNVAIVLTQNAELDAEHGRPEAKAKQQKLSVSSSISKQLEANDALADAMYSAGKKNFVLIFFI